MLNGPKRLFAILGILTGLAFVQACGRELPAEEACNFVQNRNLQRVSWDNESIVDLYLDSSFPASYEPALRRAIDHWNETGLQLRGKEFFRIRAGHPGSSTPSQDSYSKIYVMNEWEADMPDEQARTTIYWTGSRIYEADIRINNLNFDFATGDTVGRYEVHLESLLVHELGHVLGLAHVHNEKSVMQVNLQNGRSRAKPGRIDIESLGCEYN